MLSNISAIYIDRVLGVRGITYTVVKLSIYWWFCLEINTNSANNDELWTLLVYGCVGVVVMVIVVYDVVIIVGLVDFVVTKIVINWLIFASLFYVGLYGSEN